MTGQSPKPDAPAPLIPAPLIPAATVICLRDGDDGLDVLMLRRNRALKAFGGMWVFPGGRVEAEDSSPEIAAIREAREETDLRLDADALVPLSRWIPPAGEKRRFDTHFFMADVTGQTVTIDEGEIHDFDWVRPQAILDAQPCSHWRIVPPTYVSLHALAGFSSVAEALSVTAARPTPLFETKFLRHEDGFTTLWQEDAGYADENLSAPGPRHRLSVTASAWHYEGGS